MQTVSASFYEFIFLIVGVAGFEPTTPCSQSGVIIKDIQLHIS